MGSGMLEVVLSKEGSLAPWGFRLHGGCDIGYPLVIQRVFVGTTSEGELQRGDHLLQIQGRDTTAMSHREAHDLIKAAGTRLQMLIRRMPGAPQTPTTPLTLDGMHPFAKMLHQQTPAPFFQPSSPHKFPASKPTTPLPPASDYCFSPLPTTPSDSAPYLPFFIPGSIPRTPKNNADLELLEYRQEKHKEKEAITSQGYRTLPLIAPGPKTRHDIPMGSYLRHCPDPNWKGRSAIQPSVPKFFNAFPTPTYSSIGHYGRETRRAPPPGAPMFERALNESEALVHHQYNSPMYLYSQKNINDTIRDQTGVPTQKLSLQVNKPSSPNPSGPLSPGGTLAPARPGTKLINIVDITLSPTFQMIQEAENRTSSPQPHENRAQTLPRRAPSGSEPPRRVPWCMDQDGVNSFGSPREVIHQSGSFKTLMSSLYAPPPQQQEQEA